MLRKLAVHTLFGDKLSYLKCTQILRMFSHGKSLSWKNGPGKNSSDEAPVGTTTGNSQEKILNEMYLKFLDNLDMNQKQRMKRLQAEIEEYRMKGFSIPSSLPMAVWYDLLTVPGSSRSRLQYLTQLGEKGKSRNIEKHERNLQNSEHSTEPRVNSLWCSKENRHSTNLDYACYRSLVFGAPLVMDMGYDMTDSELYKCVKRLAMCYKQNMTHCFPFHIHFTGYKTFYLEKMNKIYHSQSQWYASFHETNCTDVFNKDDLVYLSPTGQPIQQFDADKTYVIGAYVNLSQEHDHTVAQARQLGIEHRRLPLRNFGMDVRDLGLNAVLDIMLEVNLCHHWEEAMYKALVCTDREPDGTGPAETWRRRYDRNSTIITS